MGDTWTDEVRERLPHVTPERVAERARASFTRCDVITRNAAGYVTFFAVYTTPEGEIVDRVHRYSDMPVR